MSVKRYHLIVMGRVQGVGFRYFCDTLAHTLGVTGWVRNTPDGNVELEVQGKEPLLDSFFDGVAKGPVLARVLEIQENEITIHSQDSSFTIK